MTSVRLLDLDPKWVHEYNVLKPSWRRADHLCPQTAQGILFLCPQCFHNRGGPVGTHSVLLWFADRGVPLDVLPGPGRWNVSGSSFEDLTLTPSVNLDNEHWHGYIDRGVCTMVRPRAYVTTVCFSELVAR